MSTKAPRKKVSARDGRTHSKTSVEVSRVPYVQHRRVRFGDCDPAGVMYTPRLGYFVVEAVLDFLTKRLGGPAERKFFDLGILPPARSLAMEYLKPMAWDAQLALHVRVAELRRSALAFSVTGFDAAGDRVFVASLTQVCVSAASGKPIAIPAALRRALGCELENEPHEAAAAR